MRIVVGVLILVLLAVAALLSAGNVTAKTYITVTPDSGPRGALVDVAGYGFARGSVTIALAPSGGVTTGFVDELPEGKLLSLARARVVRGQFLARVIHQKALWLSDPIVDVVAIQEDPPTAKARFCVTSVPFHVAPLRDLPSAGVGAGKGHPASLIWPIAALATGGALLALAALRLRPALS